MASEKCPKCGSEMVMSDLKPVYASLDAGPEPGTVSMAYRYKVRCPLNPKDCLIKSLEREVEKWHRHTLDANDTACKAMGERDTAISQLRASEARELVLREALEANVDQPETPESYDKMMAKATYALEHTSAAAQEAVKRIELEAIEKAWVHVCDMDLENLKDAVAFTRIRSKLYVAILGAEASQERKV